MNSFILKFMYISDTDGKLLILLDQLLMKNSAGFVLL